MEVRPQGASLHRLLQSRPLGGGVSQSVSRWELLKGENGCCTLRLQRGIAFSKRGPSSAEGMSQSASPVISSTRCVTSLYLRIGARTSDSGASGGQTSSDGRGGVVWPMISKKAGSALHSTKYLSQLGALHTKEAGTQGSRDRLPCSRVFDKLAASSQQPQLPRQRRWMRVFETLDFRGKYLSVSLAGGQQP